MMDHSRLTFLRGKQCLAFSFVALLMFASFSRPLFLGAPSSTVSYRRLLRYITYIIIIIVGGMYSWRRLVFDIEDSTKVKRKNILPTGNKGAQANSQVEIIDSELILNLKCSQILKIWKILVTSFLCVVVLGYVRMHSLRKTNTLISQIDNFSFVMLGFGAFLTFSLFVLDCILLFLFGCRILILFIRFRRCSAKVDMSCENNYDRHILEVIFHSFNEPRKIFYHWRRYSNVTISPVWRAVLVIFITIGITLHGLNSAHKTLTLNSLNIPVRKLPASLEHFNIVQVCDFHVGPWLWTEHVSRVVDKVNDMNPDIIVIVGDLVDLTLDLVSEALEPLKHLRAGKGIYFVAGNHDYYLHDIDNLYSYLENIGIIVLRNQNVRICGENSTDDCFYLVGTEDVSQAEASQENFQLAQAMEGVDPEIPAVLLTHQPLGAKKAILSDHRFDLILSGHTHGGQFFPVSLIVYLSVPYFQGLYHVRENTYLYVSNGVGFWGIPMRFLAPPEVVSISLVAKD